jgi:hypothetical protein
VSVARFNYDKRAPGMFKHVRGGWVKWSEHERAIERLTEERDTWRERALAEPNRINAALLDMATPSTVPTTKKETPHDR